VRTGGFDRTGLHGQETTQHSQVGLMTQKTGRPWKGQKRIELKEE
jgi:hypothetical protein